MVYENLMRNDHSVKDINRITLSAPNFRLHLLSAFFFKPAIDWKELYMKS